MSIPASPIPSCGSSSFARVGLLLARAGERELTEARPAGHRPCESWRQSGLCLLRRSQEKTHALGLTLLYLRRLMSAKQPPVCLSMILCDAVQIDPGTGKAPIVATMTEKGRVCRGGPGYRLA